MQNKFRGVMQSQVTPLKDDFSLDLPTFERLLDFHVRAGAPAISWPHHRGESLNLTIDERKLFAEAAVKVVADRVPASSRQAGGYAGQLIVGPPDEITG
jgi:4-hydroxy-tetrahydrodipicolinate synthase